ncbi:MAG TPA: ChbG/HpnK family deacetylase [Bacteroidota bacterium]|nr:ChbG/HpnK family deacetylase [Bacteroidota bacterium]
MNLRLLFLRSLAGALLCASSPAAICLPGGDTTGSTAFLIRCDDAGMCHAVNVALREVLDTGMPVSVSVMFACPWYREAVETLRQFRHVSVGVHLTLNAEWKNYRWGPVAGQSAVPSLVDSDGYFFPSRAALFANRPDTADVERELGAQIERALRTGLRIDYLDYHMSAAVSTPELRRVVEHLARRYGLGISRYFGEEDVEGWYAVSPELKRATLLRVAAARKGGAPGLLVFHVGLETPEMDALVDMNSFGLAQMSAHRQAELRALTSPEFRRLLADRRIRLETYADLIRERGLDAMKAPREN